MIPVGATVLVAPPGTAATEFLPFRVLIVLVQTRDLRLSLVLLLPMVSLSYFPLVLLTHPWCPVSAAVLASFVLPR